MGRLFWKFFLAILFAQLAATLGVGATFWVWDQARSKADNGGAAHIDAGPAADALLDAAALTFKYGGEAGLRELAERPGRMRILMLDTRGVDVLKRPVGAELQAEVERLADSAAVRQLSDTEGRRFTLFVQRADAGHRPGQLFRGGPPSGRPGGKPPEGHRLPVITMVVGTLASLLFAALLAWYFARPIRALRGAFEAAASGDLAPRFAAGKSGDELADLGHDFDRMSGQLRALMDNQRRLLHDVSHELRSPLARLQAAIGLAHQQPDKLAESLNRIERESVRMDQLVGELLTLSRLDAAPALPATEDINLAEMIYEIAADAAFEAAGIGRQVLVSGARAAQVRAAPDLLWRAIENVVRNAVKHSPKDGMVDVVLETHAGTVLLHVRDRGAGVAPADLDKIFQPFYRSDPQANNIDGHGLGLAIARRVAEAHGGTINARNRDGGGLEVTLALPAS
jgi:signal transduction histidine kinase